MMIQSKKIKDESAIYHYLVDLKQANPFRDPRALIQQGSKSSLDR